MKRLLLAAAMVASIAAPAIASAQDNHRDDRRPPQAKHWDRGNPNWWRGQREFRDFSGPRPGFWYAPGYGYYRVEPRWATHAWRRGEFLPLIYRTHYVPDPAFYGLRPPPPGYRWVYVGNNLVLMASATGLIADIVNNFY
jgi:Ni/Co efflux regulator RcnB